MEIDYKKEYEAMVQRARELHETGNELTKRQMEIVCHELRESEDERIRKELIAILKKSYNSGITLNNKKDLDRYLAYLEKQKESLHIPETCKENADSFTDGIIEVRSFQRGIEEGRRLEKQKEPHYTKRNALFNKCVENCDPKTVEEVNKRVDESMSVPELSAFEQALTNFIGDWKDDEERWPSKFVKKHGKHILDMAREELQKEQKPLIMKPHKGDDNNPYDMGVSEAQEYAIKRGFGVPFIDGEVYVDERHIIQTVGNIIRWADEHPKEQKPAEWSEEDEEVMEDLYNFVISDFIQSHIHETRWKPWKTTLERNRQNRLKSLRPSWKPSEEQMCYLKKAYESYDFCDGERDALESLYNDLLNKLGVKEEPEYYQHFDSDC